MSRGSAAPWSDGGRRSAAHRLAAVPAAAPPRLALCEGADPAVLCPSAPLDQVGTRHARGLPPQSSLGSVPGQRPGEQVRFFPLCLGRGLLEGLGLQDLAAELALQFPRLLVQAADFAVACHRVIGLYGNGSTLGYRPPSTIQQIGGDAIAPRDGRQALAGVQRLLRRSAASLPSSSAAGEPCR